MRIAHVVTLATDDGRFGGPLTVARGHVAALRSRGHQVDLVAASDSGLPAAEGERLFRAWSIPGLGFSGTVSVPLWAWAARAHRAYDVVHVHLGRDLVTMPAAGVLAAGGKVPFVVQTHGMVMPDPRARSRVMDAVATRRVLERADRVLVLNDHERAGIRALTDRARVVEVPNGVRAHASAVEPADGVPEVLFLARLHRRKRVLTFLEMAQVLLSRGVDARFAIVGPDEGDGPELLARIDADERLRDVVTYEGGLPPDRTHRRMAAAQVYVLPSIDEPFPLTLLESLAVGVASVTTDSCHIADRLRAGGAAVISGPGADELADAVQPLVQDVEYRRATAKAGQAWVEENLSMDRIASMLEHEYQAATA